MFESNASLTLPSPHYADFLFCCLFQWIWYISALRNALQHTATHCNKAIRTRCLWRCPFHSCVDSMRVRLGYLNGFLQQKGFHNRGWPWLPTPLGFRLHEKWYRSIVYPLIDKGWIMEPFDCSKHSEVKTKLSDVRIRMLVWGGLKTNARKGHFWKRFKRMHATATPLTNLSSWA